MIGRNAIAGILTALCLLPGTTASADDFAFAIGEWPPFISKGAPDYGLHSKRVSDVFQAQGHTVRFEFLPWRRSLELTKNGSLPATFSWSFVRSRTDDFLYPDVPVDLVDDVYFFRKDRFPGGLGIKSFEDIRDRKLTVVGIADYWYQEPLQDAGVSFQTVATEEEAWTMLLYGRADLYIENDVVGQVHSRSFLGDNAALIGMSEPLRSVELFILFSKIHPDGARMAEIWDKGAALLSQSDTGPAVR